MALAIRARLLRRSESTGVLPCEPKVIIAEIVMANRGHVAATGKTLRKKTNPRWGSVSDGVSIRRWDGWERFPPGLTLRQEDDQSDGEDLRCEKQVFRRSR